MNPAELPSPEQLAPYLRKLADQSGAVVLIAIIADQSAPGFFDCSTGFFDAEERAVLKAALLRVKRKREAECK